MYIMCCLLPKKFLQLYISTDDGPHSRQPDNPRSRHNPRPSTEAFKDPCLDEGPVRLQCLGARFTWLKPYLCTHLCAGYRHWRTRHHTNQARGQPYTRSNLTPYSSRAM